jgi:cytochrome c oxidase subunit II
MSEAQQGIGHGASTYRRLARCWMPLLVLLALGHISLAQAEDLSVFRPAAQPATSIRDLFHLVLGITGAIFVLVEGVLIYSAVRFRRRKGSSDPEPAQVYGSAPLEVAWTVAPLLIVFVLFLVVVRSVVEAQAGDDDEDGPVLRVQVIGHQWWWEIVYPDDDARATFRTANELHVQSRADGKSTRIELELLSADVIHSFWVPRLAGKTDLIPGNTNRMWFDSREPATFYGQCAEFCGMQHANMKILVVAEEQDDFRRWQENERKPAADTDSAGRDRFLALGCVNCHTVRGTTARGTVGPDLTHLMARRTLAAGATQNDHDQLRAWIADPDTIKPGSKMPNMHLSGDDVDLIVGFLESLR